VHEARFSPANSSVEEASVVTVGTYVMQTSDDIGLLCNDDLQARTLLVNIRHARKCQYNAGL